MFENFAIAAFVKTPGLSSVKTRLASTVGVDLATDLYLRSCKCIEALFEEIAERGGQAYWAVAESEVDARWQGFPVVSQGSGGLGNRLDTVYGALQKETESVCLIGTDCPHVSFDLCLNAFHKLQAGADFVIGPATDGGYYLLAGRRPIPTDVWCSIPYSVENTYEQTVEYLSKLGAVETLAPLTDIDYEQDVFAAMKEMKVLPSLSAPQRDMVVWVEENFSEKSPS